MKDKRLLTKLMITNARQIPAKGNNIKFQYFRTEVYKSDIEHERTTPATYPAVYKKLYNKHFKQIQGYLFHSKYRQQPFCFAGLQELEDMKKPEIENGLFDIRYLYNKYCFIYPEKIQGVIDITEDITKPKYTAHSFLNLVTKKKHAKIMNNYFTSNNIKENKSWQKYNKGD